MHLCLLSGSGTSTASTCETETGRFSFVRTGFTLPWSSAKLPMPGCLIGSPVSISQIRGKWHVIAVKVLEPVQCRMCGFHQQLPELVRRPRSVWRPPLASRTFPQPTHTSPLAASRCQSHTAVQHAGPQRRSVRRPGRLSRDLPCHVAMDVCQHRSDSCTRSNYSPLLCRAGRSVQGLMPKISCSRTVPLC